MKEASGGGNQPDILRVFRRRDQVRAYYDRLARAYDLLADPTEAPLREKGLAMLAPAPGEHLLEIGYGTGSALVSMARAVGDEGRVFGVDLSPGMQAQARERLEREQLLARCNVQVGDATQLALPENSQDGVFMSFTLELFDTGEIPVVLRECRRVLRPGGRLVVVGMSRDHAEDPLMRLYEWSHRHFPNFVDCRPIHVRQAVAAVGFEITRTRHEHLWLPVEIVAARKPTPVG